MADDRIEGTPAVSDAENYLAKAAECREQASKCPYPTDKASWLRLAERWTSRAQGKTSSVAGLDSRHAPVRTPAPGAAEFVARFFSEK
jgi:hypothetical protein